ncbi:MAG: DUF2341 domain-containing protein [Candidatus Kariarchaeaceae archaeon]
MIERLKRSSIRTKFKLGIYSLFIIGILLGIAINNPSIFIYDPEKQQYQPLDFFGVRFAVDTDENTDGDSNIDGVANVGVSNSSYLDSQSLNSQYQGFWEEDTGGDPIEDSGIINEVDYLYNNTNDNFSPTDIGTYSTPSNMNSDDGSYNTLTEVNVGVDETEETDDVDINTSDVDSNADNGNEGTFSNAQGSAPDSNYMNIQEVNDTIGEGFSIRKSIASFNEIYDTDAGYVINYGSGEGYGYNSITQGVHTIYDEKQQRWIGNTTLKGTLINCTYETAYDGFDLVCYHGIYAGYDIYFYPQNTTMMNGNDWISLTPDQLRYYQISTNTSQKWRDATVVDPVFDPNDDIKRVFYPNVYPATTYNFWYNRGSIKEIINMSALPNQYPDSPYGNSDTYLIHVQNITMKEPYTWYDNDGEINDTKFGINGFLRLGKTGKLVGVFPTGLVWSSVNSQRVEDQVFVTVKKISDTEWQLGTAIPYTYLTNSNRDDHVYIDPTWDVGLNESNWNENTVMHQTFYHPTAYGVELMGSYLSGSVTSIIRVANANWARIRFHGDLRQGQINIYFRSSYNPVQDPYRTELVKENAQTGFIYTLPSLSQEKFGQWIFTLSRPSHYHNSPRIFNITLFNDDQVAYYDPTADVTTNWNEGTGTTFAEIDDGDRAPDTPVSLADYIQESGQNIVSEFNISSVTQTDISAVNFWAYVTTGSNRYIDMDCYENQVSRCTTTSVPLSTTETWYSANWTVGGGSISDFLSLRVTSRKSGGGAATDVITYNGYLAIIYTPVSNPYIIDFEYQWSLAAGSWNNETFDLAINTANNPSTENLSIYFWNTSSEWVFLGNLSANGWTNFSLVGIDFPSPTFTIRFVGSNETANDDVQDDWDIDLMVVYTYEPPSGTNYNFDREVAFLNVTQFVNNSGSQQEGYDFSAIDGAFDFVQVPERTRLGQTWLTTSSYYIERITFEMYRDGLPAATLYAAIYATSGGVPTGSELAASDSMIATSLAITGTNQTFNFTNPFLLEADTTYWIGVIQDGSLDISNDVNIGADITASTYADGTIYHYDGSWNSLSSDFGFAVFNAELNIYTNMELVINTGSLATENISIYQYDELSSTWIFMLNLTEQNTWTNISIFNNFTTNIYFRFFDTNRTSDSDAADTWEIDYFALHLWNGTYLGAWGNRKEHNITGSTDGILLDHSVRMYVYYQNGTDSGDTVYCAFACKPDFADIRFVGNDGLEILNHWVEDQTDGTNGTFWIRIPEIPISPNNVTIYIVYGNLFATNTSDISKAFILGDDFEDGYALDWSPSANWGVTTSFAHDGVYGAGAAGTPVESGEITMKNMTAGEIRLWHYPSTGNGRNYILTQDTDVGGSYNVYVWHDDGVEKYQFYNGTTYDIISSASPNNWYFIVIVFSTVTDTFNISIYDNSLSYLGGYTNAYMNQAPTNINLLRFQQGSGTASTGYQDTIRIRNYTYNEPTHGDWLAAESGGVAAPYGWNYRKMHNITGSSAGAQTDYQVNVSIHYSSGSDSGKDVYCNSNCQTDFDDVRFTSVGDSVYYLDYWLQNKTDSNQADYWVKIPEIPESPNNASFYIFYGNTDAYSISNIETTFPILGDDFENGNVQDWNISFGDWDITDNPTYVHDGTYAAGGAGTPLDGANKSVLVDNVVTGEIRLWHYPLESSGKNYVLTMADNVRAFNVYIWHESSVNKYQFWNGSTYDILSGVAGDTWYYLVIQFDFATDKYNVSIYDNSLSYLGGLNNIDMDTGGTYLSHLEFQQGSGANGEGYEDNVFIRNYIYSEPTHGDWGSAESLAGTNYRFDWEHNSTSLPVGGDNYYNLTIYGNASENMDIYMWNNTDTDWHTSSIGTVGAALQWYNFSISGNGLFGENITWNYRDTIIASDEVNSTMAIDYAGVYVWSLSITANQDPINITTANFGTDEQWNQFPMNVTTDAGQNFDIELKCADINATACGAGFIYFDSDSNPTGYTQLTTTYQAVYTNQVASTTLLNIWFWVNIPAGQPVQTHEVNITFRILNA